MGNAGRVLMIPKGDYNPATPYEMLDCVYYNGRSYVCKQASTGHAPTDTTYWQPMTPDASAEIQALTNQLEDEAETRAELGAHNLLPPFVSQTSDGVIFTVDANGVVDIDGESTSTYSETRVNFKLKAGTYTLSGIPSAGYGNSKLIILLADLDHTTEVARDTGSGATFTLASDTNLRVFIYAYRAYGDFDHVKVYPMIRLATDADPTYQPYAMTNKELTDKALSSVSTLANGINLSKCGALRVIAAVNGSGEIPSTGIQLPEKTLAPTLAKAQYYNGSSNVEGYLFVSNDVLYVTNSVLTPVTGSYIVGEIVYIV